MADKSDDIFIDDDEFDFDLDLTETEMAWDKKTEADTPIPSTMEVSEKREGKTTATDMEDLEDIDDLDSPPSPSILSSSFSMIHGGESENGSAARENKINALRDSLYAFRANLNSEIHKISDEEKTADQQKHDKTDEMPSDSKIDDEKLNDKEQMRKLSKKTSEEKGVIESSYDTIDLTELEDIETHSAGNTSEMPATSTSVKDDEMAISVITTGRSSPGEEERMLLPQLDEDPQQGSESAVSPKSDDFSLDIPTCITCRKAKEKRNCTHRHHPYPPISQSQGPSSPSGQGGAQGVGKASFVEQRSNFGSRCGMAQDRDSASEIGLDAVKKESQKLKYSVNVQQVREIFPAVHRHFVRKLLKYLGYKFGDKETILQHAVTFLSETEYPIDGDSQWEIDAAIESLKKVVITPVGINIPKKKEPKSNVERDNFVSNWISKTDFKKAMEAVSSTPSSTDAGNFNLGGPDFDLFGFSNPDSCNLRLGLPLTPTGTSIRSLGTSIASIANSPGPSSLSGHDSSSSSVASFDNFDGKTTEVVGNSSDASVDSVKQLRKTSTSCISPEENLKHLVGKKFSDAEKVGDKKQPLNWSSAKLGPDGIENSGNRMEGLSDMEVDMGSQSTEMAKLNAKIAKMKRNKDLPTEMAKLKANPEKIKRDKEQIMKAKAQYRRLKDRDSNKSRTEGVGGKTSSSSLFTTDSILRSDVRPKVSVAETVGSTYPRFHPYPQTDKHTSMEKRSSIPEFNFSAPLSSDRPDSVNHSTTISHPVVSSSKEDDDMIMEEYNSVVSSSTIPCDSCKTTYAVKDLGQCCDCHLLCKTCLEKAAKLILVGNKSGQVICPVTDCESSVPRSELRKTLHNIMLDLLDEKWNKEAVDAMNDMEDFVRCSNCGYSVILDLTVKRHCCDKCKKTFCRFCNLNWEAKDHDLCIKTKTKNKTDGSGVIAVPAHWSPTNSEEPYEKAVVEETALEFTSISELFYSTMTRQSFKIERVYRIQNQRLWEKYMLMRTHMVEDLGEMHINERRLFHGTSTEVIPNICKEGFDWRLYGRNGSAFGQGTYFARDANYSHNYSSKHGPFGIGRHGVASLMRNVLGFGFPTHHKHPINPPGFFSFGQPNQPAQTGFNFGPYAPPNSGSTGSQPPSFQPNVSGISSTGQQSTGFQLGNSNNASGGGFGGQTQNTGGFMFGNRGGNISNSNTGFSFGGQTHGGPGSYFGSPGSGLDEMEESSGSFMFVGRVLVGRVCKGNPQMRRPPKDENDPQKRPCHTAVNHINKPSIFVVFESSQCYPEYLIEYNSL